MAHDASSPALPERADPTLRMAGPADAAALSLLGGASFLETYAGRLPGPALVAHCRTQHAHARWRSLLAAPGNAAWLAEAAGGAPVGYALLTRPDLQTAGPQDLELRRIYVLSRWQGGGTGRALLEAACAQARLQGAARLLLGVWQENHAARRFYAAAGFQHFGTRQFQVGTLLCDDAVLALDLADHPTRPGQDRRPTGADR